MRAFAVFVTTVLLLANLATAANAYAGLPNCSEDIDHATPADSAGAHASQENHHRENHPGAEAADTPSSDAGCCGTCKHYYDAHLQGLNLATARALPSVPHMDFSSPSAHMTDFTNRPNLPPPRSTSVFRLTATA